MTESAIRKRSIFKRLKRRARRYFTKRTLFWLLIIALCSLVISAVTVATMPFVERIYKIMDTGHRPTDVDKTAPEQKKEVE